MNSHTKPRHENKQDLIYLLPVSRQMPGWAGGTVSEGGRDQLRLNLAWDSQEGTVPFTSPVCSLSRTPHPPAALCNVPQSHHQCWGAGDGNGGSGDNLDPGSAPQGTAESAWHQDVAPVTLAAGTSCQDHQDAPSSTGSFPIWALETAAWGGWTKPFNLSPAQTHSLILPTRSQAAKPLPASPNAQSRDWGGGTITSPPPTSQHPPSASTS